MLSNHDQSVVHLFDQFLAAREPVTSVRSGADAKRADRWHLKHRGAQGGLRDQDQDGGLVQSDIRGVVSSAIPRVRSSPSVVPSGSVSKTSVTIAIEDDFGNLRDAACMVMGAVGLRR